MGQIFFASAYDIKTKECCVMDADKFHANCYSYCGTVLSVHYLLRQKPYRVMWGGQYIALGDKIDKISKEEDLLGISTYVNCNYFEKKQNEYSDKVKIICDNSKLWKKIDVWKEAKKLLNTNSSIYSGYLINRTKKIAVDLNDYFRNSKFLSDNGLEMAIDLIPVLTETGGGTAMALFDGESTNTTRELACTWCGNELQIVEELPDGYETIRCCFSILWRRINYFFEKFGFNDEDMKDSDGNYFVCDDVRLFKKLKQVFEKTIREGSFAGGKDKSEEERKQLKAQLQATQAQLDAAQAEKLALAARIAELIERKTNEEALDARIAQLEKIMLNNNSQTSNIKLVNIS